MVAVGVALLTAFLPGVASAAGSTKAAGSAKAAALDGPEVFLAHLTGTQETPPTGSAATGFGSVTLGADQTTITVNESWTGLTTPATISHIHGPEGPGVAAPILFPFAGVPAVVTGSIPTQSFTVTPAQVAQFRAGLMYFNVHSATDPGGEIRGQILPAEHFTANLTGSQETPPNASKATGSGSLALSNDETFITVDETWSLLTTPATISHIHGPEGLGVAAPVLFPFTGVPAVVTGSIPEQSFPVTPAQVAQLRAGLMYFNVHSTTFPAGEIRGQILLASGSQGIRTVTAGGQVAASGLASTFGPALGHLNAPIVGISSTPDDQGYWLAAADGGVFSFGNAGFFGSLGAIHLNSPIVGMAHPLDGLGYWMVGADGGVFTFGDAGFLGSLGAIHLNSPIVGMAATPDGLGYWLVGADGGVFTFGNAGFLGSLGAVHLNARIVGLVPTLDGHGYWLVGADGGVFTFGDAAFSGSAGAIHLNAPVVGIARTPTGAGYWLAGADGRVLSFGDATALGSGTPAASAFVGVAATGSG
ncbi:MAG TPA: CHRD domain-containing protein [Acidimicrobiales bacterium]|jgi:hypothetical protein